MFFKVQFFFNLHASDLFSESLVSFVKYADDVVIGNPCRDAQGLSTINNALKCVSEWSGQNGINLNSLKNAVVHHIKPAVHTSRMASPIGHSKVFAAFKLFSLELRVRFPGRNQQVTS